MTGVSWDDARLDAAFAAMARAHPVPADLVSATSTAVATPRRAPFTMRRAVAAMALVAGAIVVISGGILGYQAFRPVVPAGTSPANGLVVTASPANASPDRPTGTPVPSAAPLALPVIGVGDAIAIRDRGIDASEIAVRGWYENGGPVPCPSNPAVVNPLQPNCPDDRVWLMRDPETLFMHLADGGETMREPKGPGLNPDLDSVDPWVWGPPPTAGAPQPVELVMVGHFDDPLAATCPTEARQACRDRFLVDQVLSPDGSEILGGAPRPAPVIPTASVSDAITVRANGTDRHEIAVRGWYSDAPPTACPITLEVLRLPLEMSCPDQFMWLMQDAEQLHVIDGDTETERPPVGPALNPDLDGIDRGWIPNRTGIGPMPLVDVVMVGHFDDPRAANCPKNERQGCRDRFVVDQVWSGDRTELLATTSRP